MEDHTGAGLASLGPGLLTCGGDEDGDGDGDDDDDDDDDDTQSLWLEVFCAICFVSLRVGVVFFRCWCESLRSDPP